MKAKNKLLALLEIAVVLCSVLLVATLPGVAADQTTPKVSATGVTTASEDDYVLGIYGNANEDDTIDMRDYTFTARLICWLEDETELADANYDGRISVADMTQIGLIILGRESELTYEDIVGVAETVHKPIERIADMGAGFEAEVLRVLDAEDKIVAVSKDIADRTVFFPELSKLPVVAGSWNMPDYEAILAQNPDAVITYIPWADYMWAEKKDEWKEKLPGVTVISLGFINPVGAEWTGAGGVGEHAGLIENTRKLGYILDKEDEAEVFCDWYEGYLDKIKSRTEGLSEAEKPRVYTEWGGWYFGPYHFLKGRHHQICTLAGGIDLLDDLPIPSGEVDPEWVVEQNPDIIISADLCDITYGMYKTDDSSLFAAKRDSIMDRPELANVSAVKSGRVYMVESSLTNGPHTIIAIAYEAKWSHPDLFEDLDPQAIHQEYLDRFHPIDFDVRKHGVFVYPPL